MPRLLVLAAGELTGDPRARRTAIAAAEAGYEVTAVCAAPAADAALAGIRIIRVGRPLASGRRLPPAANAGAFGRELRGAARSARLTATTLRLVRAARPLGRFDVVHAHDFDTLPAGRLLRGAGTRLVYDAHELYSDQEPRAPRLHAAMLRALEAPLAHGADAVVTVCDPLAEELWRRLRLRRPPIVVLGCPPREQVRPAPRGDGPLRALYQGASGPGRRLTDLLDAAAAAVGVELTIRVVNAELDALRREVAARGLAGRVRVVGPVPPDRLVEAAAEHHVGLVINRPLTRNDELVLPNKLFEYLMAGLAVAAPRLPALEPLVAGEGVGLLFEPARPDQLAAALTRLARDGDLLARLRTRARARALERYNAETEAAALLHAWRRHAG